MGDPSGVEGWSSAARLRSVTESVNDAVISADGQSRILFWNSAAERVFGWSEEEALGRPLTMLMPERYRRAHLAGMSRLTETGEARVLGRATVELEGLHRDGYEFPVELSLGSWHSEGHVFYTGVVRDISQRKEAEHYLAAAQAVTAALASSSTIEDAGPEVLATLAEHMNWQLGALWLVDETERAIRAQSVWHAPDLDASRFQQLTMELALDIGVGLPGTVWDRHESIWFADISGQHSWPRLELALTLGLQAAVGIALISENRLVGVLEFFSTDMRPPEPAMLKMMATIGSQVGQFLQRKASESALAAAQLDLQRRSVASQRAQEINDNLVQGLALIYYAADRGEVHEVSRLAKINLTRAQDIVNSLLFEAAIKPGALRRRQPASPSEAAPGADDALEP